MQRIFFAINLPPETKHDLAEFVASFSPYYKKTDIRWVAEENFHGTLIFLGDQEDSEIDKLKKMARIAASQTPVFSLQTREISALPNLQVARLIFLETHENPTAKNLVQQMRKQFAAAGFKVDQRPWHAHITIGRAHDGAPLKLTDQFIEHEIPIKSFELMKSELGPKGPTYQILESFPLQG